MFYIKGRLQVKGLKIWKICLYFAYVLSYVLFALLHITSFNENEVDFYTESFNTE